MYITVKTKFILTEIIVLLFTVLCSFLEIPWWMSLRDAVGPVLATIIVIGLAFFPGIMISTTLCGIIFDKPRRRKIIDEDLEDITVLIAAYNEEDGIYDTLASLAKQNYPKKINVKVIDNNSKDNTKAEIYRGIKDFPQLNIEYFFEKTQGKFAALNNGLASTATNYVITLDADTYLHQDALRKIVYAIIQENQNKKVGAIAGTILVHNGRENILTRMQEWEYFLSIAGIKRCQGLFQSVLVAQGAFSIYGTKLLKEIGGWKNSIGEDIVLTWEILSKGYKTYYEDCALAFTNVPSNFKVFIRQRARWARGMVEGFRHFSFSKCKSFYAKFFVFTDIFLFFIDFSVSFFFIGGIIAAIFWQNFLIVGPMTLILLPITILFFSIMFISEYYRVFKSMNLNVDGNLSGLICYILSYSIILSPACVWGYLQELGRRKHVWR